MSRISVIAIIACFSSIAWAPLARAASVEAYPAPIGAPGDENWFPVNSDYEVTVDGVPVEVWDVEGKHVAHFAFEGSAEVEIKFHPSISLEGAAALPSAFRIKPKQGDNHTLSLKIRKQEHGRVVVRPDGTKEHELILLGDPVEETVPANFTYYVARGQPIPNNWPIVQEHFLSLGSGQSLYIEAGAVLNLGVLIEDGAEAVKIAGRGVLRLPDGQDRLRWSFDPEAPMDLSKYTKRFTSIAQLEGFDVHGVDVDGIIMTNGIDADGVHRSAFQTYFRASSDVTLNNIKLLASQAQSNGLTFKGSKQVTVNHAFIGAGGNPIVIGGQGTSRGVHMKHVVSYQLGAYDNPKERSSSTATVMVEGNYNDQFWHGPHMLAAGPAMSKYRKEDFSENFAGSRVSGVTIDHLYVVDQFKNDEPDSIRPLVAFLGSTKQFNDKIRPLETLNSFTLKNVHMEPHLQNQMLMWAYDHGNATAQSKFSVKNRPHMVFDRVSLYNVAHTAKQPGAIRMTDRKWTLTLNRVRYDGQVVSGHPLKIRESAKIIDAKVNEPGWPRVIVYGRQACAFAEWEPDAVYEAGDQVSYAGRQYEAQFWTQGQQPDLHEGGAGSGQPWSEGSECSQCEPQCTDRACGDDGCGGSCGYCSGFDVCSGAGQCEALPACDEQVWNQLTAYQGDERVSHAGYNFEAWYWTQGDDPLAAHGPQSSGQPWGVPELCVSQ